MAFSSVVWANPADDVIAALQAQVAALTERVNQLEDAAQTAPKSAALAEADAKSATVAPATAKPAATRSWADRIKLKGDLRYRHEGFDIEDRPGRQRQRIRARVAATGEVSDRVDVGFGLASGGGDPVSTNQTLGSGASSKGVVIDLAFAKWQTPVEGLAVAAGKFKNPLHRAGDHALLWDGDLNPEGVGAQFRRGPVFANGLAAWVNESSRTSDVQLLGGQLGIRQYLGNSRLVVGAGYYDYLNIKGVSVIFDGDPRGNRTGVNGEYLEGFQLLEAFAEYSLPIGEHSLTVFGDYVNNLAADDFNEGFALGLNLKAADWKLGWAYQDLAADAVFGLFTDSDFIGGGTDGRGHILQASYSLTKRIGLKGTLFVNERNIDFGEEEDFKRLMLDISFKY